MSRISSLAAHRKSMKSAAPASSAPLECSSVGRIRSESRCSVAYSCAVSPFGWYLPFCPAASCAIAWWTCCESCALNTSSPTAARLTAAPMRTSRSRRENSRFSDIALPHLLNQIFGGAPGERHDAQGHVLVGLAHERRRVADKQIFDVVRLVILIQRRGLTILAHPHRARFVNDETAHRDRLVRLGLLAEHRSAHGLDDRCEGLFHVAHLLDLALAPGKVEAEHRDPPGVHTLRIDIAVAIRIGEHLAASGEGNRGSVFFANFVLQRLAVAFMTRALTGERPQSWHAEAAADFDVIAAREVLLLIA